MKISWVWILTLLLVYQSFTIKLFLLGWTTSDQDPQIYNAIANSTSKTPLPNKCNQDWTNTSCPKIAVITSAAQNQAQGNHNYQVDVNEYQTIGYRDLFIRHGLSPNHVSIHVDNYQQTTDQTTLKGSINYKILQQADIIYFDGGDQSRHSRCWLQDNQLPNSFLMLIRNRAFNDEVVLAGTSAGTMIMSSVTFGGGRSFGIWYFANSVGLASKNVEDGAVDGSGLYDIRNGTDCLQYDENGGKIAGFGFVNFVADTHFEARGRLGRLVPVLVDLNQNVGVGIDQATAIYLTNNTGTVIGKNGVYIVDLTNAQRLPKGPYFQLNRVTVNYLTENDTYDFNNKKLTSSKTLIKNPYYIDPTDSNDILQLNGNQCKLLITRLVDQKAYYNIGRTKIPSSDYPYPSKTPTFEMVFYKYSETRGYFKNGKYTAENVLIDYEYLS